MSGAPKPDATAFQHPGRGGDARYERYLRGMNASMRQKVALTAAHLLAQGRIADMGMGSGAGSQALAALYPGLSVVGVDVDPQMVARARERHVLPNLAFVEGDIGAPVFPPASLDGIFDSSVLHHLTTFGGYDHERAADALRVQVTQLREGGVLVVRDFVDPGGGEVVLELPDTDGDASSDPRRCASAPLFERFAREFRSLHPSPGFAFRHEAGAPPGWRRYRVPLKLAAEFVLRKDYREDWEAEVKEEYTYFTQQRFEALFSELGLRLLASSPLWNPWIVQHRFEGKFRLLDPDGAARDWPPTNYVVVGEKVPDGEGVRFREGDRAEPLGFLQLEHHRDVRTGRVLDLVRRPNLTLDVVPYFSLGAQRFVLARMSYPRPLLRTGHRAGAALDGATPADYVTEPLTVMQTDRPLGRTVEDALGAWAAIPPEHLRHLTEGARYYPSPGGVEEEVRSVFAEVEPLYLQEAIAGDSGWSTSGRVRAIEAQQVLRASQVGGLPDARLELNVYELLLALGEPVGPWIGEAVSLESAADGVAVTAASSLEARPRRRSFARAGAAESTGFLELAASTFEELDRAGGVLRRRILEYVVPRRLSCATVSAAVLARVGDEPCLGLDDDDLPAAQSFTGHSDLMVAPAWRLPAGALTRRGADGFLRERLARDYGVQAGRTWELGGAYHPSAGATPEVVFPRAVEVRAITGGQRPLCFVPVRELLARRATLRDGHLRIALLRAAHALSLIDPG